MIKNAIFFSLALILFTSCNDDPLVLNLGSCDYVAVNIENETGKDLKNFVVGETTIDNFKAGDKVEGVCLDNITLSGDFPLVYFDAKNKSAVYKSVAYGYFCGVGMIETDEGEYTIVLDEFQDGWNDEFEVVGYEVKE